MYQSLSWLGAATDSTCQCARKGACDQCKPGGRFYGWAPKTTKHTSCHRARRGDGVPSKLVLDFVGRLRRNQIALLATVPEEARALLPKQVVTFMAGRRNHKSLLASLPEEAREVLPSVIHELVLTPPIHECVPTRVVSPMFPRPRQDAQGVLLHNPAAHPLRVSMLAALDGPRLRRDDALVLQPMRAGHEQPHGDLGVAYGIAPLG